MMNSTACANPNDKLEDLKEFLRSLKKVAVCFSSGVDSTFLLKVCADTLGKENVVAVTATGVIFPKRETEEAQMFCKKNGINQILFNPEPLSVTEFSSNPKDRCYHCKKNMMSRMISIAKENGFDNVAEGSNMDDLGDYRPGLKAIDELGIISPLRHAKLSKDEIRALSKELGLNTFCKESFACLASRFVYGEPIDAERLNMVEHAEDILHEMNFRQFRVRVHGAGNNVLARIELLPDDIQRLMAENRGEFLDLEFKKIGFKFVSLDLSGYKTGKMNVGVV